MCQLQHRTLPIRINFIRLKPPNNSLKQIHYLLKHGDVVPTQKKDSHPILVDYGEDQFTLRVLDKGNTVRYTPLDSFSFNSVSSFLIINKKPMRNKVKTSPRESLLLNESDLYEDDDLVSKRSPHQKSHQLQSSPVIYTPNSQKIYIYKLTTFFDPSFFAHCKAFEIFIRTSDAFLTIPLLLQAQKDDPVLSTVYAWLKDKRRPPRNIYILTQIQNSFNTTLQILSFSKKSSSKLNLLVTKLVSVYHLNSSMLLLF